MVVKTSEEMKYAFKTVKLGVSGYLSKQETMACIKEAIFCGLSGKEYISQVLANHAQDNFELGRHEKLSGRINTLCHG